MAKHIFISHSWDKNSAYKNLTALLDGRKYFTWEDHSVPRTNRIHTTKSSIIEIEIANRIRNSDCVLIIASMEVAYSDWLQWEIFVSQIYRKPIIGIIPRGAQRIPTIVRDASSIEVVHWNTKSIINAIRNI